MPWDVRFGTGGWQGFPGGLAAYARMHGFVELNASHYGIPRPDTARRWRARVPEAFEFAAVLPRHVGDWRTWEEVLEVLRARYVVVHPTVRERKEAVLRTLRGGRVPVLETRTGPWAVEGGDGALVAEDPSREGWCAPPVPAPDRYLRVFGAGTGVLEHLGAGMVRRVAGAVREITGRPSTGGRVRIVVHSYSMHSDLPRLEAASGPGDPP